VLTNSCTFDVHEIQILKLHFCEFLDIFGKREKTLEDLAVKEHEQRLIQKYREELKVYFYSLFVFLFREFSTFCVL
jgi:hypothetical protein